MIRPAIVPCGDFASRPETPRSFSGGRPATAAGHRCSVTDHLATAMVASPARVHAPGELWTQAGSMSPRAGSGPLAARLRRPRTCRRSSRSGVQEARRAAWSGKARSESHLRSAPAGTMATTFTEFARLPAFCPRRHRARPRFNPWIHHRSSIASSEPRSGQSRAPGASRSFRTHVGRLRCPPG